MCPRPLLECASKYSLQRVCFTFVPLIEQMSSGECTSPTRCRPQHLDRERLRGVLSASQYADVRYQEAVVFASWATPKCFQLLALAIDCVYLFPLSSSHDQQQLPTRIPFTSVVAVDYVSPGLSGQRGMMLEPTSQLFHILVRETVAGSSSVPKAKPAVVGAPAAKETEYFVSTFEPESRVFFYVLQAFNVHFQVSALHVRAHASRNQFVESRAPTY